MDVAIGLLGGSFDPVHYGHLQLARDALLQLPLSEIRFIPAAQPWQKTPMTTAAEHRAKMVRHAIAAEPRFALDMHEIERGGPTYTIDTVHALRMLLPDTPLVLIMGSDQLARLDTWRDWEGIVKLVHVAVAQRARISLKPNRILQTALAARRSEPARLSSQRGGSIVEFPMTPSNVSATEVRRLLRDPPSTEREQRLAAMVPGEVLDYIRTHHLYGP